MKMKMLFMLFAFLPMLKLIGGYGFLVTTHPISKNFDRSSSNTNYNRTHLIHVPQKTFAKPNNKPVVKIISPKDKSSYPLGIRVAYEISVSDQEDGESKYGEINQNEVLLKVALIENTPIPIENNKSMEKDTRGLMGILKSNCLNCHAFKSKLIGPSFYEITKHYQPSEPNLQTMASHIADGSSGVWGNKAMPAHPELSTVEIQGMVQWIMKNAGKESINYYTGTEGSIKLQSPEGSEGNISFVLTASYTDHGIDGGQNLEGLDSVVIYSTKITQE